MKGKTKYTKEVLEPIVVSSKTMSDVLKSLGLKLTGGNFRYIKGKIREANLSMRHFVGSGWSKGLTKETDARVSKNAEVRRWSDEEIFVENSPIKSARVKQRLVELGWPDECRVCGNKGEWLGKPLALHLDHINGNHSDNRKQNLRILCPNCHQQKTSD